MLRVGSYRYRDLSNQERRLWDLAYGPDLAQRESTDMHLEASLISELLKKGVKPAGVSAIFQLSGRSESERLRIHGKIEIPYTSIEHPIIFRYCDFDSSINLMGARLCGLTLEQCTFVGINGRYLENVGNLSLDGSISYGEIVLSGARIDQDLHLDGVKIFNGWGFIASDAVIGGTIFGRQMPGKRDSHLETTAGMSLERALVKGAIHLDGAQLKQSFAEPALCCTGMRVEHEFHAERLLVTGEVNLVDAVVRCSLQMSESCLFAGNSSYSLNMDRLRVSGSLYLNGKHASANRFEANGQVRGLGMRIGDSIYLDSASLSDSGANGDKRKFALALKRTKVGGNINANHNFVANGEISLKGARVSGSVRFKGASLSGPTSNITLEASGLFVGRSLRMISEEDKCFSANGSIILTGAHIRGRLSIDVNHVRSCREPALDLCNVQTRMLEIHGSLEDEGAYLDLTKAAASVLLDDPGQWNPRNQRRGRPILNGMSYEVVHANSVSIDDRLRWLKRGTSHVRAASGRGYHEAAHLSQPYNELAEAYRRSGYNNDARKILFEKYCDRDKHTKLKGHANHGPLKLLNRVLLKFWFKLQQWFIGYGYKPQRAFYWLFSTFAIGVFLLSLASDGFKYTRSQGGADFTVVEKIGYVADALIPALDFGESEAWRPHYLYTEVISLILVLLGVIYSAAIIAAVSHVFGRAWSSQD